VKAVPVIDLSDAAAAALSRMLENGRVIGRDDVGRRVLAVAVDDWVIDWFGKARPLTRGTRRRRH
jgi:hypothetical protein